MNSEVFVAEGFHLVNRAYSLFVCVNNSVPKMTSRPQEAALFGTSSDARKCLSTLLASKDYGEYAGEPLVCQAIDEQYDPANWLVVSASVRVEHGSSVGNPGADHP